MWFWAWTLFVAAAAFAAGILLGRTNRKKADRLAEVGKAIGQAAQDEAKRRGLI